jgi:hypothetical protein
MDEVPESLKEDAKKAKDSAYFVDSFQDTVAKAEILVPGIRIPTFDKAAKPKEGFKRICNFRRQALDLAHVQPSTRALIEDALAGKDLDTKNMTCDAVRVLFNSVAGAKAAANNAAASSRTSDAQSGAGKKPLTPADLNRLNAAKYANQ